MELESNNELNKQQGLHASCYVPQYMQTVMQYRGKTSLFLSLFHSKRLCFCLYFLLSLVCSLILCIWLHLSFFASLLRSFVPCLV